MKVTVLITRIFYRVLYALRRASYVFYSDDHLICDLCARPTRIDALSDYYNDVHACKRCCPDGYRDLEAEGISQ